MADEKRTLSPMDRVWNFFTSVKLAVFTLIVLAVASILGTLVEQNQPPEKYHEIYEDWAFALMDRINLFDMYHSWWFLALLVLFTVNLACCTIDRFPKCLSVVRNPRTKLDESLEKTLVARGPVEEEGDRRGVGRRSTRRRSPPPSRSRWSPRRGTRSTCTRRPAWLPGSAST